MDIICPRCTEPWDNDELHELVEDGGARSYDDAARLFRAEGCSIFTGVTCERKRNLRSMAASAMYDLCGEDMDGAAALMDDFEYMGFFE